MPDVSRIHDFQEGDIIDPTQVDNELNQLVIAVNGCPDMDGTLQDQLNADLLDGFHASEVGGDGTIPVCNGDLQVGLNAEFLGGLAASDIADAGFPAGTRLVFAQATVPAGWTAVSRPAVDRVLGWGASAAGGAHNAETTWANLTTYYSVDVDSHVLTLGEIPAHTHALGVLSGTVGSGGVMEAAFGVGSTNTGSSGGGGGHTHTGGLNNGASPAINYRPPIHWIVIGSKN